MGTRSLIPARHAKVMGKCSVQLAVALENAGSVKELAKSGTCLRLTIGVLLATAQAYAMIVEVKDYVFAKNAGAQGFSYIGCTMP